MFRTSLMNDCLLLALRQFEPTTTQVVLKTMARIQGMSQRWRDRSRIQLDPLLPLIEGIAAS